MTDEQIELLKKLLAAGKDIYWVEAKYTFRPVNCVKDSDVTGDGETEPVAWLDKGECVSLYCCEFSDFVELKITPIYLIK